MKLAIVVPCYNEASVIRETTKQLSAVCEKVLREGQVDEAFVLYVDDGSQDATWAIIEELSAAASVKGLKLAHNPVIKMLCGPDWNGRHPMLMLPSLLTQICKTMWL